MTPAQQAIIAKIAAKDARYAAAPKPRPVAPKPALRSPVPASRQPSNRTPAATLRVPLPCVKLGAPTGETLPCPTCTGSVAVPIRACSEYGECSESKLVKRDDGPYLACCTTCTTRQTPPAVRVPVAAEGIGDHMIALSLAVGQKQASPATLVYLDAKAPIRPWLELFAGVDGLVAPAQVAAVHDFGNRNGRHYADVATTLGPRAMPTLKPLPPTATEWASRYAGCVVLAPRTAHAQRNWSLSHWLELESLLAGQGHRTVIVGSSGDKGALQRFRSPTYAGESPQRVAALMKVASAVVANESGMAHLAGALAVPCVVLAAQLDGRQVHGFWPRTTVVQGPLGCSGCKFTGHHYRQACHSVCASLQAIDPTAVLDALAKHLPAPKRLSTRHPVQLLTDAGEFPRDEMAALFSQRDQVENLAEWLARYAVLFGVVKDLAPRRIVEIGVRAGYSSWTMLKASPGASLLAIDLNVDPARGNSHGGYLDAWKHAAKICAGMDWRLLVADSHRLDRLPESDLVYVDGDHEYSGCLKDLELAERSGAKCVLVDDYSTSDLRVRDACDDFVRTRPHARGAFVDNGSTGLYLIRFDRDAQAGVAAKAA